MEGLNEHYTMETQNCEFHEIKIAKAPKNFRHFPKLYIGVA